MAPHPIPLPCTLAFSPSSHRDATTPSPCWAPHFYDPRTHHVLESHPEQAAPLSRRDDERWHAIGSHSALALSLYLAACNPSSSCRFWVLDHLCSNLFQSFYLCWITEIWSLNRCVCFYPFLFCLCFSDRREPRQYQKYSTILILVLCLTCLLILLKLCSAFTFLQQLMTKRLWVIYTYTCSPMFSIDVVASAPDDPCICW